MAAEDYHSDFYYELGNDTWTDSFGEYRGPTNDEEEWDMGHHCDGVRVLRTNHINGDRFWGCSLFPKCRHTAPYRG